MATNRLYDHRGAAKYLKIHPRTLEHRVLKGLVEPLRMVNNDRVYTEESLDRLKEKMKSGEGEYTLHEIAEKYGIDYYRVYRAFKTRREIVPERVIGRVAFYNEEQVKLVAQQDNWESA